VADARLYWGSHRRCESRARTAVIARAHNANFGLTGRYRRPAKNAAGDPRQIALYREKFLNKRLKLRHRMQGLENYERQSPMRARFGPRHRRARDTPKQSCRLRVVNDFGRSLRRGQSRSATAARHPRTRRAGPNLMPRPIGLPWRIVEVKTIAAPLPAEAPGFPAPVLCSLASLLRLPISHLLIGKFPPSLHREFWL